MRKYRFPHSPFFMFSICRSGFGPISEIRSVISLVALTNSPAIADDILYICTRPGSKPIKLSKSLILFIRRFAFSLPPR